MRFPSNLYNTIRRNHHRAGYFMRYMYFSADSFAISKLITIFAKYANGITNLRKRENISIF